ASAVEGIEALGYHLEEFDADGDAIGTAENDVFVYAATSEDNTSFNIDLFGDEGDDVLFIGADFAFNDDIENGDASVLEVFFVQEGNDTLVQVEKSAFGSNAAQQELDTITLTGVNAEDLAFQDGYVVI